MGEVVFSSWPYAHTFHTNRCSGWMSELVPFDVCLCAMYSAIVHKDYVQYSVFAPAIYIYIYNHGVPIYMITLSSLLFFLDHTHRHTRKCWVCFISHFCITQYHSETESIGKVLCLIWDLSFAFCVGVCVHYPQIDTNSLTERKKHTLTHTHTVDENQRQQNVCEVPQRGQRLHSTSYSKVAHIISLIHFTIRLTAFMEMFWLRGLVVVLPGRAQHPNWAAIIYGMDQFTINIIYVFVTDELCSRLSISPEYRRASERIE